VLPRAILVGGLVLAGCNLALPLAPPSPDRATDAATPLDRAVSLEAAVPPDSAGDRPQATWCGGSYSHGRNLVITETAAGPLPAGYSVKLVLDTAKLVADQQMLVSGDDLRVVRVEGGSFKELDRRLINPDSATTEVWFKTAAPIDGESREYYLCHGDPSAGAPPAHWSDSMGADSPSRVYLAADDFEEHAVGDCPDGWEGCDDDPAHPWQVVQDGNGHAVEATAADRYLYAGQQGWTDISMEARVWSANPDGCPGIASRVQSFLLLVYAGYNCDNNEPNDPLPHFGADNVTVWVRPNATGYYPLFDAQALGVVIQPKEWHHLRVAWVGQEVRLFHDGALAGKPAATDPQDVMAAGRIGLYSTYGNLPYRADDVVVRLYVHPEPTVTLAP
jgi:hypothetical protein